jgi:hypothetical protein
MKIVIKKFKNANYKLLLSDIFQQIVPFSFDKLADKEIKAFNSLKSISFACENDANRALNKLTKKLLLLEPIDTKIMEHKRYKKAGKPKKNQQPDFYEYC